LEESKYQNRLANNQVRLNLFNSRDEHMFNSMRSSANVDDSNEQH